MIKHWTDICGCDLQGIMVSNRVDFWPNKSQKKLQRSWMLSITFPQTKLSQLYSTEKTSGRSSVSAWLDREWTSSLTSLELDEEIGAPLGVCKVGLGQSLWEGGNHFSYLFTSLPQTQEEPRGSFCLHLVSSFHVKLRNEAQVQAIIVRLFQVT